MIEKIEKCWEIVLEKIGKERMAYICQLLSCIFWVFSFTYVIDHQLNAVETLLAKGLTGTFLSYLFILMFNISIKLNSHTLKYANRIFLLDALQILSLAFTQLYLAMPIVHSISCTIIVITPLIEYMIYQVKMSYGAIVSLFLGFGGVLLLANNKWLNGEEENSNYLPYISIEMATLLSLMLFLVCSLMGYAYVSMKEIQNLSTF